MTICFLKKGMSIYAKQFIGQCGKCPACGEQSVGFVDEIGTVFLNCFKCTMKEVAK